MERLTGTAARIHYLIVCLAGGIAGALGYIAVTLADPYGTTAAAKAEEKRKRDRFEFLSQNRGFADSKTDDSDSNHEKPPAG